MDNKITNKIHVAIRGTEYKQNGIKIPENAQNLMKFLEKNYGFYDLTFVTGRVYNTFLLAMDQQNRMLFIKSGRHPELYKNEYVMGRALWEADHDHFLEPLYYSDKGEFFFFANEIMMGESLQLLADLGKLKTMSADKKIVLLRDLHKIFLDLKQSDVVHRDIRPDNFAVINDRLYLIDFQLAVSKSHYEELESLTIGRIRGLGTKKYRYKMWKWDDSYSLLKCARFIGCPAPQYREEYNKICNDIKSYIGHDVILSAKRENGLQRLWRHLLRKLTKKKH